MAYKVGKGKPPKSTQFKKGQSGNPEGARRHNQELKKLKKVLRGEIEDTLNWLLQSNMEELKESLKDKDTDILTLALGSVLAKCIKKGDWNTLHGLIKVVTESKKSKRESRSSRPKVVVEKQFIKV